MKVLLKVGISLLLFFFGGTTLVWGQVEPLKINPEEVYVEPRADGFHLFIKKVTGRESVMLTESFELPNKKIDTYSLRAFEENSINAHEKRLLNGKFLNPKQQVFLISSTPEDNIRFEKAFHILIPTRIEYGYKDSKNRYGIHDLLKYKEEKKPYWFSIRAFSKPYIDYSGEYLDNAYELFISAQEKIDPSQSDPKGYYKGLQSSFSRFSQEIILSKSGQDLSRNFSKMISQATQNSSKESIDIAIVLDTTLSMRVHLPIVKKYFLKTIEDITSEYKSTRVAFVFYRDYLEKYLTKTINFQENFSSLENQIRGITAEGGGDFPEAVHEGIYAALTQLAWRNQNRLIIVIGDAPPHEIPRGDVTEEMVLEEAKKKGVSIYSILLPFEGKGN